MRLTLIRVKYGHIKTLHDSIKTLQSTHTVEQVEVEGGKFGDDIVNRPQHTHSMLIVRSMSGLASDLDKILEAARVFDMFYSTETFEIK